jgi:hypothetical protein
MHQVVVNLASKQQMWMTKCLYSLLVSFIMHYSFI